MFCSIINPGMSDHCKSNEIVESAIEKRLMIMMRIKEIHKLNVVKKKKKKITSASYG